MKTDDLVNLLAADTLPVQRKAAPRRLALALAAGLPLAAVIMLLEGGVRRDIGQAMLLPMFWVKLLVPALIAAAGFAVLQRLARPGARPGASWLGIALPVLLLWALAAVSLATAPPELRASLVMGQTWRSCSASIALISLPLFIAAFVALASLAPTRLALAGACAGVMAGGAGAAVYALHCPELEAPFLAVWYLLGMAVPVAAGALLGPRLLRW
ncbi:MAG: DUF1109 domain-containing protein [Ramlibacter sp.]|nr:DUF1109 domain-containing protein [Ramlibacter sp.]